LKGLGGCEARIWRVFEFCAFAEIDGKRVEIMREILKWIFGFFFSFIVLNEFNGISDSKRGFC
jgi:hypothetical protein